MCAPMDESYYFLCFQKQPLQFHTYANAQFEKLSNLFFMVNAFTLLETKIIIWMISQTFSPAGTEFNEQLHRIVIHICWVSQFEIRVSARILYFLLRGWRLELVETDNSKSQSCISGLRSIQLIRQPKRHYLCPIVDL